MPRLGKPVEGEVHDLVEGAARKLSQCQHLKESATSQLFSLTGISNPNSWTWFKDKSDLGFSVSSSNLEILRAWNHSGKVQKIVKQIQSDSWSYLGDLIDIEWLRWRIMFKRIEADEENGIEVITQKPLFHLFPEGRWISRNYLLIFKRPMLR